MLYYKDKYCIFLNMIIMIYLDFYDEFIRKYLIINKLLYKIYYQNNVFVFNKCRYIMVFENKSL